MIRWMILFFLPSCVWGGTCPSAANYLNATTMSLVTLSSLGITNCYYIAANGSDSNSGATEASPWLHAPQMPSCSGNCASHNVSPGDGYVFRGGDTWHFGASTGPSVGGTWSWSAGGSSGSPIYIGVDQTWYSGSSWARPIFTGDNSTCGTGLSNCTAGPLSTYPFDQYYVASCSYQVGSHNQFINFAGNSHFIWDNFELTGLCQSAVGQPANNDTFFIYGSASDVQYFNLYVHGWTHVRYADVNGGSGCTGSTVCFGISVFAGGSEPTTPDDVFRYDVIDGSDSDPIATQTCYCDFWDVAYSYIGNQSGVITRYPHLFHDNLYEYWLENGHGNVNESVGDAPGPNAMYNNVFRHINVAGAPGDPLLWWLPGTSTTDYFFNNLIYDVGTMEYFIAGNNNSNTGTYTVFNNTFQSNYSGNQISCSATGNSSTVNLVNNNYVSDNTSFIASNCASRLSTNTNGLLMSNSTATSDAYTSSENYAYSPASGSSPTVGQGTSETNGYCAALGAGGLTSAQAACAKGTDYACSYNTSSHTVSCPALAATSRSSAWDVGAYQYSASTNSSAQPPSGLGVVTQ